MNRLTGWKNLGGCASVGPLGHHWECFLLGYLAKGWGLFREREQGRGIELPLEMYTTLSALKEYFSKVHSDNQFARASRIARESNPEKWQAKEKERTAWVVGDLIFSDQDTEDYFAQDVFREREVSHTTAPPPELAPCPQSSVRGIGASLHLFCCCYCCFCFCFWYTPSDAQGLALPMSSETVSD